MTSPTDLLDPVAFAERVETEGARRRTFAIISHPYAG